MIPKGYGVITRRPDLLYDPRKVTGSWEVDVTYFMNPKVTVTFVVGLTWLMTQKGHGVIWV